jgi:hypothetical protein
MGSINRTLAEGSVLKSFAFTCGGVKAEAIGVQQTSFLTESPFFFSQIFAATRVPFPQSDLNWQIQPLSRKQDAMRTESYGGGKCVLFDVFHPAIEPQ